MLSGRIVVGEKIFDGEWPAVEYFDIVLSTATPAREWHYEGTPEESDDDEDINLESESDNDSVHSSGSSNSKLGDYYYPKREAGAAGVIPCRGFRTRLAPRFNAFLLAVGRAVKRMPSVKRLSVMTKE